MQLSSSLYTPTINPFVANEYLVQPEHPEHGQHVRNRGTDANRFVNGNDARLGRKRAVAEQVWRPAHSEPYALGENFHHIQAATSLVQYPAYTNNTITDRSSPHSTVNTRHGFPMSAQNPSMTSQNTFTYPSLDNMDQIHNAQPYLVDQERNFDQMPEAHQFEQHQEPPSYPSPTLAASANPYNSQQIPEEIPEQRMDGLPSVEPKSEADAPSPEGGRSKAIPKPDRQVTKDANGRFYCNWPGCTEEVKDFGRKCEWK